METMVWMDLTIVRRSLGRLVWSVVIIAIFLGAPGLMAALPAMLMSVVFQGDESRDWQRFRLTLPVGRHEVVRGRYGTLVVITLMTAVLAWVVGIALGTLVGGRELPEALSVITADGARGLDLVWTITAEVGLGLVVSILITSISVPLYLRLGVSRGALAMLAMVALVCVAGVWVADDSGLGPMIAGLLGSTRPLPFIILGVVGLLALGISLKVSETIYDHRDL